MVEIEIQLGCKRCTLSFGVFDEAHCTKGKEGFSRIRVEFRLDVGNGIRVLSG